MGYTQHNMVTGHQVIDHKATKLHSEEAEGVKSFTSQGIPLQDTKTLW